MASSRVQTELFSSKVGGASNEASCATEAARVLREVFGFEKFRGGQRDAVLGALSGRDVAVLLSTGAGKSLCYQVPAVVLAAAGRGLTVVVSPLIALMQDQVGALVSRGVAAAALHSHQEPSEQHEVLARIKEGRLDLLYVSPERAVKREFRERLQGIQVALLAVDEAHCVSQWGHDFRPDYLQLGGLRDFLQAPTMALTATATVHVQGEIERALALHDPVRVRGSFARPELAFSSIPLRTDAQRLEHLCRALASARESKIHSKGRALVYCATRKKTQSVAAALKKRGIAAGYYHAGRTPLARERAHRAFDDRRLEVLVATSAFGMGIDYEDVRVLVHFQMPGSIEAYYQEAGRAGRDGRAANCLLFHGASDILTQRRLNQAKGRGVSPAERQRREDALQALIAYTKTHRCRQAFLIDHFAPQDAGVSGCGCCDVCRGVVIEGPLVSERPASKQMPPPAFDSGELLWIREQVLSFMANIPVPLGKMTLVRALRGSRARAVRLQKMEGIDGFGTLKEVPEPLVSAALESLVADNRLLRRGRKYPTLWLEGREPPVRGARTRSASGAIGGGAVASELESFRRRTARKFSWKPYQVFHRKVVTAVSRAKPQTMEDLAVIPGLGPINIERYGDAILKIVREHG